MNDVNPSEYNIHDLLDLVYRVVLEATTLNIAGSLTVNSMGHQVYADAIRLLAYNNVVTIVSDNGRWVTAHPAS
jgi:hypothetical protein